MWPAGRGAAASARRRAARGARRAARRLALRAAARRSAGRPGRLAPPAAACRWGYERRAAAPPASCCLTTRVAASARQARSGGASPRGWDDGAWQGPGSRPACLQYAACRLTLLVLSMHLSASSLRGSLAQAAAPCPVQPAAVCFPAGQGSHSDQATPHMSPAPAPRMRPGAALLLPAHERCFNTLCACRRASHGQPPWPGCSRRWAALQMRAACTAGALPLHAPHPMHAQLHAGNEQRV